MAESWLGEGGTSSEGRPARREGPHGPVQLPGGEGARPGPRLQAPAHPWWQWRRRHSRGGSWPAVERHDEARGRHGRLSWGRRWSTRRGNAGDSTRAPQPWRALGLSRDGERADLTARPQRPRRVGPWRGRRFSCVRRWRRAQPRLRRRKMKTRWRNKNKNRNETISCVRTDCGG